MKKVILMIVLFVFVAISVNAETLVYDANGKFVGELKHQGFLFKRSGVEIYGMQIWIPKIKKLANVSTLNGNILNRATMGWGGTVVDSSNTIGVWEDWYFISNGKLIGYGDIYGADVTGFEAEYCEECSNIFPVKIPLYLYND